MAAESRLIANLTRGTVVCERVVVADRPLRRMHGLLGRRSLPEGEGMLLQPAPSIHTAFMRFPIDAVFLDGTLRVLRIVERLPPWRAASGPRARAVLELSEGESARRGIEIGDLLSVVEVGEHLEAVVNGPNSNESDENVRVLLVGTDRRFRAVAAALLTRRGCSVAVGDRIGNAAELAKRHGSEVVVLDATAQPAAAAQDAARIEALRPPVGVVVVRDAPIEGFAAPRAVAKWGSFDQLYGAIEHARPSRVSIANDAH
jgi:uncharacterized protein